MERLLELILGGGLRLPLFDPDLLSIDRDFPKSDLFALLILQRRSDLTMSDLAAGMGAPLSTATGIGARLARRGLAERRRATDDKRVVLLNLTPAGQSLAGRVSAQIDGLLRRIQSVLTPDEVQQMTTLAFKVIGALSHPPDRPATPPAPPENKPRRIIIEE